MISCCPGSTSATVAPNSSEARAPVETQNATSARSRCEPSCANSSSNRSSGMHRGARATSFGRYRPLRCPANGLHRVVVRMRAPGTTMPRQRERVDHRPGARLQMEVVEAAQHALAMRHRRRLVPVPTRRLAGHRVHRRRRPRPDPIRRSPSGEPPMRPRRLDRRPAASGRNHAPRPESPDPNPPRSPTRTGTSAADPSHRNAASSPAAHTPPTRRRTPRPARPPRRRRQRADTARTALRSPQANRAAAPPARTTPAAHPRR